MTGSNVEELDSLLEKYSNLRIETQKLQEKMEKYKKKIKKILDAEGKTRYEKNGYSIRSIQQDRYTISQKNLPREIWETYRTKHTIRSLYIHDKRNKTTVSS